MKPQKMDLRYELYPLFFEYCDQQGIDGELRISNVGIGELFSLTESDTVACWRTWSEGFLTLKSLVSGKDEWLMGVRREEFQREYPDAYEHFLQTTYRIDKDLATDFALCYRNGEVSNVVIIGWRQE